MQEEQLSEYLKACYKQCMNYRESSYIWENYHTEWGGQGEGDWQVSGKVELIKNGRHTLRNKIKLKAGNNESFQQFRDDLDRTLIITIMIDVIGDTATLAHRWICYPCAMRTVHLIMYYKYTFHYHCDHISDNQKAIIAT